MLQAKELELVLEDLVENQKGIEDHIEDRIEDRIKTSFVLFDRVFCNDSVQKEMDDRDDQYRDKTRKDYLPKVAYIIRRALDLKRMKARLPNIDVLRGTAGLRNQIKNMKQAVNTIKTTNEKHGMLSKELSIKIFRIIDVGKMLIIEI